MRRYLVLFLVLLAGIALALPLADAAGVTARTFTVDSTADEVDAAAGDGVCRSSAKHCTLRAALNEVSALPSDGKPVIITVPAGEYKLQIDPPGSTGNDEAGGDLDLTSHGAVSPRR